MSRIIAVCISPPHPFHRPTPTANVYCFTGPLLVQQSVEVETCSLPPVALNILHAAVRSQAIFGLFSTFIEKNYFLPITGWALEMATRATCAISPCVNIRSSSLGGADSQNIQHIYPATFLAFQSFTGFNNQVLSFIGCKSVTARSYEPRFIQASLVARVLLQGGQVALLYVLIVVHAAKEKSKHLTNPVKVRVYGVVWKLCVTSNKRKYT